MIHNSYIKTVVIVCLVKACPALFFLAAVVRSTAQSGAYLYIICFAC